MLWTVFPTVEYYLYNRRLFFFAGAIKCRRAPASPCQGFSCNNDRLAVDYPLVHRLTTRMCVCVLERERESDRHRQTDRPVARWCPWRSSAAIRPARGSCRPSGFHRCSRSGLPSAFCRRWRKAFVSGVSSPLFHSTHFMFWPSFCVNTSVAIIG